MEATESMIPPFVFVDGRKYILAEQEERPEPEILKTITPPPRMISGIVQMLVRLNDKQELLILALALGCFLTAGAVFLSVEAGGISIAFSVLTFPILPFVVVAASRLFAKRKQPRQTLWLMEYGYAAKGRFYNIIPTGKRVFNIMEMALTYQFTMQDGHTFNAVLHTVDYMKKNKLALLADESLRLIFYDPDEPSRNVLFDSIPQGITFDDVDQTFKAHPLILCKQLGALLLMAALVPLMALLLTFGLIGQLV